MVKARFGMEITKDMWLDCVYAFVVFVVICDFYLKMSKSHLFCACLQGAAAQLTFGFTAEDFSYQYFFPFRPLLIVLRSRSIRQTAENFLSTLWAARDIGVLYFTAILVASALGTVMFRNM